MYFDDYFNKKHSTVNLGNKNVTSKEDFLQKIRDDDKKEKEQLILSKSKSIISSFLSKNITSSKFTEHSKLISNLNSISIFIEQNANTFDSNKKEQIIIKTLEKTIDEINRFLSCKLLKLTTQIELSKQITFLLNLLSFQQLKSLFNKNSKFVYMIYMLIKIGTRQIYYSIKNDYLIHKNQMIIFPFLVFTIQYLNTKTRIPIIKHLAHNVSYIYILHVILDNWAKILNKEDLELFIMFCDLIAGVIISNRKHMLINNKLTEDNTQFILTSFLKKLQNVCLVQDNIDIQSICPNFYDLTFSYSEHTLKHIISEMNNSLQIKMFFELISQIKHRFSNNNIISNESIFNSHYIFFYTLFENLTKSTSLSGVNRADILNQINILLEYLFKNTSTISENNILFLIYHSAKLIEFLYLSNYEKSDYPSILDHIVNKIAIKNSPNLTQRIFTYSVDLLKQEFPSLQTNKRSIIKFNKQINVISSKETTLKQFEIISFFLLTQINYKSNYFFLEFKTTKEIYQNLPFNYYYLNIYSKYLISTFNNLISKTNIDELEHLSQNMLIKCLKSLYLLDGEINFTYNREQFWNNLELVSKITKTNTIVLLEIMKLMPFIFPLKIRLDITTKEIRKIKENYKLSISHGLNRNNFYPFNEEMYEEDELGQGMHIVIPRESLFESAMSFYLQNLLKPYSKWNIVFVDKFGNKEDGVDSGGLYKEFMGKLSEEAFSDKMKLFIESESGFLIPNKESYKISDKHLLMFEFLGFITAKAILDDIKLYPNLSPIFLNNILNIENSFTDLKGYDSELYKNLSALKQYEGDVENDFGLTFSICEENAYGKIQNINLIENGVNIPVTNNNRLLYIQKITEYKLNFQFKEQCSSFRNGIQKVLDMEILKLFTGDEMRQLIYGFDKDAFDVLDMRTNISYVGWDFNKKEDARVLNDFFRILDEFDDKEKEKFLFFCTSLKRLPIGGFSKLRPTFVLAKAHKEIPTSSTCVNMLKLPCLPYKKLKEMLRYVINADAGFYYA